MQVTLSGEPFFIAFESEDLKEEWLAHLHRCVPPEDILDTHRRIRSLSLQVAQGRTLSTEVPNYFCVVYLQSRRVARTQVVWKAKDGAPAWNEEFRVDDIPDSASSVEINVFSKKSTLLGVMEEDVDLGFASLSLDGAATASVSAAARGELVGDTLMVVKPGNPVQSTSLRLLGLDQGDLNVRPSLAVHYALEEELVLPLFEYWDLVQLIIDDFDLPRELCHVDAGDETFSELLQVLESQGRALSFVMHMLDGEIRRTETLTLLFRENTAATKFVVLYLRVIALEYVRSLVDPPAADLIREIDQGELTDENESEFNVNATSHFWQAIYTSPGQAPLPLKAFCKALWERLESAYPTSPTTPYTALASFLFLRTICPAILSIKPANSISDTSDYLLTKGLRAYVFFFLFSPSTSANPSSSPHTHNPLDPQSCSSCWPSSRPSTGLRTARKIPWCRASW